MLDTGLVITTAYVKPFTNKTGLAHFALEFMNERLKGICVFVTDVLTLNVHVHSCLCWLTEWGAAYDLCQLSFSFTANTSTSDNVFLLSNSM
jgi:hypothetical protein